MQNTLNDIYFCKQNTVYFWRQTEQPYGVFSNWAITPFTDQNGISYMSTEHYMMYHKALLMNDTVMGKTILAASTPKQAKDLGRKIRNWDETKWVNNRERIMYDGILLKCRAHPNIADLLVATKDAYIAEASPYDAIWGIGVTATEAAKLNHPLKFKGLNLLGIALMNVRKTLNTLDAK